MILTDSILMGPSAAAKLHKCSRRVIMNYRDRLATDREFAVIFSEFQNKKFADWRSAIPEAILSAIDYLQRAAAESDYCPEYIRAICQALEVLSQVQMRQEIVDVQLRKLELSEDTN